MIVFAHPHAGRDAGCESTWETVMQKFLDLCLGPYIPNGLVKFEKQAARIPETIVNLAKMIISDIRKKVPQDKILETILNLAKRIIGDMRKKVPHSSPPQGAASSTPQPEPRDKSPDDHSESIPCQSPTEIDDKNSSYEHVPPPPHQCTSPASTSHSLSEENLGDADEKITCRFPGEAIVLIDNEIMVSKDNYSPMNTEPHDLPPQNMQDSVRTGTMPPPPTPQLPQLSENDSDDRYTKSPQGTTTRINNESFCNI